MLMIPTPTISEAYGMVVQDESQRAKVGSTTTLEIGAATVAYNTGQGATNTYEQRTQAYCEYCKMIGHSKDVCYKLVGYPADFKQKRNLFERNTIVAHNVQLDESQGSKDRNGHKTAVQGNFFIEEQYQ